MRLGVVEARISRNANNVEGDNWRICKTATKVSGLMFVFDREANDGKAGGRCRIAQGCQEIAVVVVVKGGKDDRGMRGGEQQAPDSVSLGREMCGLGPWDTCGLRAKAGEKSSSGGAIN